MRVRPTKPRDLSELLREVKRLRADVAKAERGAEQYPGDGERQVSKEVDFKQRAQARFYRSS
jgi:hypothetical protein